MITDNGSNIKKAFSELELLDNQYETCNEEESDDSITDSNSSLSSNSDYSTSEPIRVISVDKNNKIQQLDKVTEADLDRLANEIQKVNSVERYGCAGHNIQLAVNDALKDKDLECIIKKVSKLISKSKKSNLLSDELRNINKFLHKNNKTRCNSTYTMISSYLKLTQADIIKLLSFQSEKKNAANRKKLILSNYERDKLVELQKILADIYIFTEIIQGDNVTISRLVPALYTIVTNLKELKNIKHLNSLKNRLIECL